jgi:uncharacterized protein with von Willebrand factor type A (vWA) domain
MKERSELDRHLLEFAQLLREGGIPVNLTEVQDALYGLTLIGMENKSRVEGVLQATLVKSITLLPWFQEAFRIYFASPEAQSSWKNEAHEHAKHWEKGMAQSHEDLRFHGEELGLSEDQRATYMQLPEEEKERLKNFLARSEDGVKNGIPVDHSFQPMIERVLRGSLEYWRRKLGEEDFPIAPPGEAGLLSEVERAIRQKELHYLTRDLKDIPPEEWPKVIKLIRLLSQRLASQVSRRLIQGKRGNLDMRRTLRDNLRYGGVFLKQSYRTRRPGRLKYVLLCDLSGSMVKYTEFVLQFVYGLTSVVSGIETYAFADRLVNLTSRRRLGASFQEIIHETLVEASREWGGGTNLAVSLKEFLENHPSSLSQRTVLFIISDAQTLEGENAARLLKTVQSKVREIIWLNTLPKKRWKETKTIELFQPYCQMLECYTLGHLQSILSAKL